MTKHLIEESALKAYKKWHTKLNMMEDKFIMMYLEKYLSEIKTKLPDIENRLNTGADKEQLDKLKLKMGCDMPDELISLYQRFDGENLSISPCFFAGLLFLPVEKVLYDLNFFQSADDELTSMGTTAIQEKPMRELKLIPFAFDGSRAWLAMDLSPTKDGTVGQIITVDYDGNYCYLLANSMDDLLEKMTLWLQNGTLFVNAKDFENPFIQERSGHLFNSLEELTTPAQSQEASELSLPKGFWQEYYKQSSLSVSCLKKEKRMLLKEKELDCTPFAYMANMKELILHDCHLKNLSAIAQMPQLKKLIFARCTIDGENLSALSKCPSLKELGLNIMSGAGLAELTGLKTLKCLQVRALTDISPDDLAAFTALQELSIENMGLRNAAFIGGMKNLKKLNLYNSQLIDLDFLKTLKKLTEFHLTKPAENEDGLSAVSGMAKLKDFIYPVKDISIYKGLKMLECVGIAVGVSEGFEVFAGSRVNSFTLLDNATEKQLEETKQQMDKYAKIYSWGTQKG